MRDLQTSDIFAFVRVITKAGLKEELKEKVLKVDNIGEIDSESFGYDLIFTAIEKCSTPDAEKELYTFFGNIFEMKPDEVKKMDAIEFLESVTKIADLERWKNFFSSAAKLMK